MPHDTNTSTSPVSDCVSLVSCCSSKRVLVQLVPVGAVVTQRLVGCSDVLKCVTSTIADVLHQRIVMRVVLHVIVTCDQVSDHGLHHVDVWTSVGWHAGAVTLGLDTCLLAAFAAGLIFLLFDWHDFVRSGGVIGRIVQMSQIDHRLLWRGMLNARFR